MWKKSLVRGASSYCISVSILLAVSTILALGGKPTVCVPSFIDRVGGNLAANLLQPLIVGLIPITLLEQMKRVYYQRKTEFGDRNGK